MQSFPSSSQPAGGHQGVQCGETSVGASSQSVHLMGSFAQGVYTLGTDAHGGMPREGVSQVSTQCGDSSGVAFQDSIPARPAASLRAEDSGHGGPQPVHQGPKSTFPFGTTLRNLKSKSISSHEALFLFGVFAAMKKFTHAFQYAEYFDRKWMTRLMFADHTICKEKSYDTKFEARADACREALNRLKPQLGGWMIPPLPWDDVASEKKWFWCSLLQGMQNHNIWV